MSFTSGTATDMGHLFELLYDNAIAEGWVNLGSSAPLEGTPLIGDAHRYWRVMNVGTHGDTEYVCANLEFRAAAAGADQTGSGTAIAIDLNIDPEDAFGGVTTTEYVSGSYGVNSRMWLGYDFGSGQVVREIAWRAGDQSGHLDNAPASFKVQWSDDALTWYTEWEVSGEAVWTVGEERVFTNPTAVSTPYPFLSTDRIHFNLQGPGVDAAQRVYLHFAVDHDPIADNHWFELYGFIDYNAAYEIDPGMQVGGYATPRYMSGWNGSQDYWFYENDRRLIAVVQMNTIYTGFYAGFFLPWALPTQYEFPLLIIGDADKVWENTAVPSDRRMFYDPGNNAGIYRNWEGNWRFIHNHDGGSSAHDPKVNPQNYMWPYGCGDADSYTGISNWCGDSDGNSAGHLLNIFDATAQDELAIWPVCLGVGTDFDGMGVIGAMDGVWCPVGNSVTPEQAFSVGGRDFRLHQNLNRVDACSYGAVEEV